MVVNINIACLLGITILLRLQTSVSGFPVSTGFICAENDTLGLYADVTNCSTYYECDNSVPSRQTCPPGQQFSFLQLACTWPALSDCGLAKPSTITPDRFTCPAGHGGYFSDVTDCSKYWHCDVNSVAYHATCAAGLYFNPTINVCDYPANVVCAANIVKSYRCPPVSHTTLHRDPINCTYYYQCVGHVAYHMPCPTGLFFNPSITRCDYPHNVHCTVNLAQRGTTGARSVG